MPRPEHDRVSAQSRLTEMQKFEADISEAFAFPEWDGSATSSIKWDTPQDATNLGHSLQHQVSNEALVRSGSEDSVASGQQFGSDDPMEMWSALGLTPSDPPSYPTQFRTASMPTLLQSEFSSRNNSTTSQLADSIGGFDINHSSQVTTPVASDFEQAAFAKRQDGGLNIAARRNRARPAPIGTAALRSRSFGPASLSPNPMMAQSASNHGLRHVKSTGYSLNSRYSGISKSRAAQRSPLNFGTFAEAGVFGKTIAEEPSTASPSSALSPPTPLSPAGMQQQYTNYLAPHSAALTSPFGSMASGMSLAMDSPPDTPMGPDMLGQMQFQPWMQQAVTTPQQEQIIDYTPPYSAGLMTSNSFTHSCMASPDFAAMSKSMQMPMPQSTSQSSVFSDHGSLPHDQLSQFQTSADGQLDDDFSLGGQKASPETSFYMHTFPEQKEAHRHVAQQMAQSKPKSYTFANQTPATFNASPGPSVSSGL